MPRIRWVIEEKTLLAFRDYELLEGGNPGAPEPGTILGQPVAAFEIEKHLPGANKCSLTPIFLVHNPHSVAPVVTDCNRTFPRAIFEEHCAIMPVSQ